MRRRWVSRLALAVMGGMAGLVLFGELGLRVWRPPAVRLFDSPFRGAPGERVVKIDRRYEVHPDFGIYQVDRALGYRPVPGGREYGPHGAKWNDHALEKPPGRRRLLFLGDSVTDRHKLIDALREVWGEGYEYWNAGVTGYATEQEFRYYRDHLGSIAADHVLLTFHLNDYETTPIVFESGGEVVKVHAKIGDSYPDPWLMRHSFLYRFGWASATRWTRATRPAAIEAEVERNLAALRDLARERGADLTVLILPWLQDPPRWPEAMTRHHELTLRILERLGIRHYAFLETLERALSEGLPIHEAGSDPQHPSPEFARRIAADLLERGFRP
jgi:hypothetical protein